MSVIDEIKQRTDIVAVVGQYATLQKAGRTLRALCPFHSEKTPSFFVYPDRQSWHCFGACSTGGDVISFIMKKENMVFGEALRFLAQRAGVLISTRIENDPDREKKGRLYLINEVAAQFFHNQFLNLPAAEKARQYVVNRGILPKTVADFQIGFAPNSWEALKQHLSDNGYSENEMQDAGLIIVSEDGKKYDRFRGRLMFPIKDERKHNVGFGARVLDDSLPKYMNSPQTPVFDKSGSLYGIDIASAAIRQQNLAVIVEGYLDVIIAHQNGFANVVASMGTAITDKQVNTLKRLTGNLALALDADAAGEEAMLRCVTYENILDAELKVILLPEGKDPDDVVKEGHGIWQELVGKAIPVIDYTFDIVAGKVDLRTANGKSAAARRLLPVIGEIKDAVRRGHYLQKLAKLTRTLESSLETELRKMKVASNTKISDRGILASVFKSTFSNPREEYCLALLLRYPELKAQGVLPVPEYFDNTENREIFLALLKESSSSVDSIRSQLDTTIWEHFEDIAGKDIPEGKIEEKFHECTLSLRKKYLQNLEIKKAEVLLLEREMGGTAAELAKQEEQGIEVKTKLLEVFTRKGSSG